MADETLNANDGTLNVRAGSLGGTSMRYHELALQRWLNHLFFVREGYPVPVVFTSPMDAFSYFAQLWSDANNPFDYLLNLKDANGTPLYEPHPSPIRYPIISVYRKGWKYRQYQNFSIHRWRHINWPAVANAGPERYGPEAQGWDLTKCRLGNVTTSRFPMAWDYRFQIDHFCNRPDTQAFFIERLMQEFWRTGGTVPQTWMNVPYPGWGNRYIRIYLDGDIENLTPEEPEPGKNVEFRTSFTIVVEGFDVDLYYEIYPALWNLVFRFGPVAPIELDQCFNLTKTVDLRESGTNTTLDRRPNVPSWGTCQDAIQAAESAASSQTNIYMVSAGGSVFVIDDYPYVFPPVNNFGVFTIGTTVPVYLITGHVTENGTGMENVPLTLTGAGTAYTDVNGSYGISVFGPFSGVAQPIWFGGDFAPQFRTYTSIGTNQFGQDYAFTGTAPPTYLISGTTTANAVGFSTQIAFDGLGTFTSAADGSYGVAVDYLYSGTARPLLENGVWVPDSRSYVQVMADFPNQDYAFSGASVAIFGTDYATANGSFVYGSADLYAYTMAGEASVVFAGGTVLDASVFGGTHYDYGTHTTTFYSGTLYDSIIWFYGTDYGTTVSSFLGGTLFDTIVSTSSTGSSSVVVSLTDGTLALLMIEAGTRFGQTAIEVSFLNGTLA